MKKLLKVLFALVAVFSFAGTAIGSVGYLLYYKQYVFVVATLVVVCFAFKPICRAVDGLIFGSKL